MVKQRIRVWDWSIRLFHWTLVLAVAGMWWTAEQGYMMWHKWLGAGLFGLLSYRLVWGLIGPKSARLMGLVPRPKQLLAYLNALKQGRYIPSFGHSPLGGLAVIALLTLLLVQTVTGLFSVDVNGLASGWFGHLISFDLGRSMADIHEMSFDLLFYMIALHLLAIAGYAVLLRTNLISPMITGNQTREAKTDTEMPVSVVAPWTRISIAISFGVLVTLSLVWFGR